MTWITEELSFQGVGMLYVLNGGSLDRSMLNASARSASEPRFGS